MAACHYAADPAHTEAMTGEGAGRRGISASCRAGRDDAPVRRGKARPGARCAHRHRKEQMQEIRTLSSELLATKDARDAAGRSDVDQYAAHQPHRGRDDVGNRAARAGHVPAQTAALEALSPRAPAAGRSRAGPARDGGRRRTAQLTDSRSSSPSWPSTCRRRARTSAAASPASCTTNWGRCSPPPSSMPRASSRASGRARPRRPSASPT
jgi:hypothetical protein